MLAELPTTGGRGAEATLGNAQISDPHTPAEHQIILLCFLGLFGGRLHLDQLGSVQPSSVWLCQHSGSAGMWSSRLCPAGLSVLGTPRQPLAAVLGLLCPCPCTPTAISSVAWLSVVQG